MKLTRLIILIVFPALLFAAGEKKDADRKVPHRGALTLPAAAKKIEPFTWRYTDEKEGKTWIYRQTPFGLVRYEEEPSGTAQSNRQPTTGSVPLKAFDDGDKVRFERQGPFGKYQWVRKKTELTAEERQAWEKAQQQGKGKKEEKKNGIQQ